MEAVFDQRPYHFQVDFVPLTSHVRIGCSAFMEIPHSEMSMCIFGSPVKDTSITRSLAKGRHRS
jgi:hypothetical protein